MRLFRRRKAEPAGGERRFAQHLGDLWQEIDTIARQDGLTGRSAVEHYNLTAEGKKDVERWLEIYLRRIGSPSGYRLPEHAPRHRGYRLLPRVWPDGLRWEAVHEETLLRAPVPESPDREALIAALDRHLDQDPAKS